MSASARLAAHQKWKSSPALDSGAPTISLLLSGDPCARRTIYGTSRLRAAR
jgi:hypothetical protein